MHPKKKYLRRKNESNIPSETNHPMNRFTIHYIAIPAILVAILIVFITKFNDSEDVTPVIKHVSPTKLRVRENSTVTAMSSNRIRRDNSATSEDVTHNPRNTSEEFWSELLLEVQTNEEFNDRETGSKLITIASNPKAPESIRKEAIADALVFIDDENYEHDIKPLAIRTDLPDTMHNIILDDLLNRPQPTALPLARYIASTNGHVLAEVLDEYVKSYE
jgi:hypothetical protein